MLNAVRPNVQFGANNELSLRNLLEPVLGGQHVLSGH